MADSVPPGLVDDLMDFFEAPSADTPTDAPVAADALLTEPPAPPPSVPLDPSLLGAAELDDAIDTADIPTNPTNPVVPDAPVEVPEVMDIDPDDMPTSPGLSVAGIDFGEDPVVTGDLGDGVFGSAAAADTGDIERVDIRTEILGTGDLVDVVSIADDPEVVEPAVDPADEVDVDNLFDALGSTGAEALDPAGFSAPLPEVDDGMAALASGAPGPLVEEAQTTGTLPPPIPSDEVGASDEVEARTTGTLPPPPPPPDEPFGAGAPPPPFDDLDVGPAIGESETEAFDGIGSEPAIGESETEAFDGIGSEPTIGESETEAFEDIGSEPAIDDSEPEDFEDIEIFDEEIEEPPAMVYDELPIGGAADGGAADGGAADEPALAADLDVTDELPPPATDPAPSQDLFGAGVPDSAPLWDEVPNDVKVAESDEAVASLLNPFGRGDHLAAARASLLARSSSPPGWSARISA